MAKRRSMSSYRFSLAFFLLLSVVTLWAQQNSTPRSQSRNSQHVSDGSLLVQQILTALTRGAPVSDAVFTGEATVRTGKDTESGQITLTASVNGQAKSELGLPSGMRSSFEDFSVAPHLRKYHGPDGAHTDAAVQSPLPHPATYFPTFPIAVALNSRQYAFADLGQETFNRVAVRHLAMWERGGKVSSLPTRVGEKYGQLDLYVNAATLLPVSLVYNIITDGPVKQAGQEQSLPMYATIEIRFSDYRSVQDRMVAFHVETLVHDVSIAEFHLSSVTFNTGATVRPE